MYPNDSFTYFEKTAISREFQPLSIGGNTYTHVRMGNTVTCSLAQTHEHQCAVRVRKRHVMAVLTAQDKNQLQPAWVRARGRERAQEREREREQKTGDIGSYAIVDKKYPYIYKNNRDRLKM